MNLHLTILQHQHTMSQSLITPLLQLTMSLHHTIHLSLTMIHITRSIMTHTIMNMEYLEFLAKTTLVLQKLLTQNSAVPPFLSALGCTLILSQDARHTEYVMMGEMAPLVQGLSALMVPCLIRIPIMDQCIMLPIMLSQSIM